MEKLLANPTSAFAVLGVFICIVAFIVISRTKITTKVLVNTAMLIALALILHTIKVYHIPQGGSVTLASMVPLLLIGFAYGPGMGILGGFIFGMINFIMNPYIVHPVQVLFDYPLPFMALGLTGFFKDKIMTGSIIAIAARFACHVISGVVFFASYAPKGTSPLWYSVSYNAMYLVPDLVITLVVFSLLPTKRLLATMRKNLIQ